MDKININQNNINDDIFMKKEKKESPLPIYKCICGKVLCS